MGVRVIAGYCGVLEAWLGKFWMGVRVIAGYWGWLLGCRNIQGVQV